MLVSVNPLSLLYSPVSLACRSISCIRISLSKTELKKFYKDKKAKPLDLRKKLTRAKRRALTKSEKNVKSRKERKKMRIWPQRTFAVKAWITNNILMTMSSSQHSCLDFELKWSFICRCFPDIHQLFFTFPFRFPFLSSTFSFVNFHFEQLNSKKLSWLFFARARH